MQRQRGELVPIGNAISGLDDAPRLAIREESPQSRHHFTRFDQVNQLVTASEADPDLGFMARLDGALLIAAHQSRRPERVQARQRAVLILGVQ